MQQAHVVRIVVLLAVLTLAALPGVSQALITHRTGSAGSISVPSSGNGAPYPSTVNISGVDGVIDHVVVDIVLTHSNPDDLDILLVGPTGVKVLLMSDAGGTSDLTSKSIRFLSFGG